MPEREAERSSVSAFESLLAEAARASSIPLSSLSVEPPLSMGEVLFGQRFTIQHQLGAGGTGVTYAAFDRERDSVVALKLLSRVDPARILRFKSEFRSLADTVHPNLVRLHGLFTAQGRWFFTMDLVRARTFDRGFEAPASDDRPALAARHEQLRRALRQLSEGVSALHRMGKVHRDLKPSNVLIAEDGQVTIVDFGLVTDQAGLVDGVAGVVGTPGYISPEQLRGAAASPASDWYAVGVMLHEALMGRMPHSGSAHRAPLRVPSSPARAQPEPLERPDLPRDLVEICRGLLLDDWDGTAYAVDAETGEIRWQRQVTTMLVRSTPVVSEDRVYLAAGPHLVALSRSDGSLAFETLLDAHPETLIDGSPKLVDGMVVVGVSSVENSLPKDYTFNGAVVAIDAASGEELWRFKTTGDEAGPCPDGAGAAVWSTPAVDRELGLLYVGSGQNYEEPVSPCSDALLAIHYRTDHGGERLAWKAQYTPDDIWAREPLTSLLGADADVATPALFEVGGKPVVGAADKKGRYRVYERATGEPVWERELDHGDQTVFFPPSAFHDGTLYMVSNHLDLISDESNPMRSTLYALDAETGQSRWEVHLPMIQVGAVAIANGVLYHATLTDGVLYAREPTTGEQRWTTTLNGSIAVGPSIVNGQIYVSSVLPGEDEGFGQTTALPAKGGVVLSFGCC